MIILLKKAYNFILRKSLHWRLMKAGAIEVDISSTINDRDHPYIELFPLTFRAKISYDDVLSSKNNFITRNYSNYAYTFDYYKNAILINIINNKDSHLSNFSLLYNFDNIRVVNLLSKKNSYIVKTSYLVELLSQRNIKNVSYLLSVSPFGVKKMLSINFYIMVDDDIEQYSIIFEFLKTMVKTSIIEFSREEKEIVRTTRTYPIIDQTLNLDIAVIELLQDIPGIMNSVINPEYLPIVSELPKNLSEKDMTSVYALIEMIKV